jgi:hypothetical protein
MPCPKCNYAAASGAFCILCGTSLQAAPALAPAVAAPSPPPPPNPFAVPGVVPAAPYGMPYAPPSMALIPVAPMGLVPFRCPTCSYLGQPLVVRRISQAGWVTFGVLLVLCPPLFWIGLLIKEPRSQCPKCRVTY